MPVFLRSYISLSHQHTQDKTKLVQFFFFLKYFGILSISTLIQTHVILSAVWLVSALRIYFDGKLEVHQQEYSIRNKEYMALKTRSQNLTLKLQL